MKNNIINLNAYKKRIHHSNLKGFEYWLHDQYFDEETLVIRVKATFTNDNFQDNPSFIKEKWRYSFLIKCEAYNQETKEVKNITIRFPSNQRETINLLRGKFTIGRITLAHGTSCEIGEAYPYFHFKATHFTPISVQHIETAFKLFS